MTVRGITDLPVTQQLVTLSRVSFVLSSDLGM